MKRFYFALLVSIFTIQIFASDLVLIPTKNFDETKSYFKNPVLTINFYKDEFIIATLDGSIKSEYIILDDDPWLSNSSYFLVYIDETVSKEEYNSWIDQNADVLYDGSHFLVLRIDETNAGQFVPAKNDGAVRITNKQVTLPKPFSYNSSTRWDPDIDATLNDDDVSAFLADYRRAAPEATAEPALSWFPVMRRLVWLRTTTWCLRWAALQRRGDRDWSARTLSEDYRLHIRSLVEDFLSPERLDQLSRRLSV